MIWAAYRRSNQDPKVGPLCNPSEEPDSCLGRRAGTHRAKMRDGIISNERIVKPEAFWFVLLLIWKEGVRRMSTTCFLPMRKAQCGELHAVLVCASCLQSALARILTRRRTG